MMPVVAALAAAALLLPRPAPIPEDASARVRSLLTPGVDLPSGAATGAVLCAALGRAGVAEPARESLIPGLADAPAGDAALDAVLRAVLGESAE